MDSDIVLYESSFFLPGYLLRIRVCKIYFLLAVSRFLPILDLMMDVFYPGP